MPKPISFLISLPVENARAIHYVENLNRKERLDKVYLDNTNLIFALAEQHQEMGNIRETVFFNQMRVLPAIAGHEQAEKKSRKIIEKTVEKYYFCKLD